MHTTALCSLLLAVAPFALAERAPSWLMEISSGKVPRYESGVSAVVLLRERTVTVRRDGMVSTSERGAVRILSPSGRDQARAMVVYQKGTGTVKSLRGVVLFSYVGRAPMTPGPTSKLPDESCTQLAPG